VALLLEQGRQMLSEQAQRAQQPIPTKISAGEALALAHERFPNLTAAGILGAKQSGQPIDPAHVTRALAFMAQCRKSKVPAVHSYDAAICDARWIFMGQSGGCCPGHRVDTIGQFPSKSFLCRF
jgi:hypothetical protein